MSVRQPRERIPADHPLLNDLNEEDLLIAHSFHHAVTSVRRLIIEFLSEPDAAQILTLVRRIHGLPPLWVPIFEDLLAAAERGGAPPEGVSPDAPAPEGG